MKPIYIILSILLSPILIWAQNAVPKVDDSAVYKTIKKVTNTNLNPDNLADAGLLYKNGNIYLVVLVLLTIFAGIIFYLVRLDKKITELENKNN
jgi:uncharacterized membrane protein